MSDTKHTPGPWQVQIVDGVVSVVHEGGFVFDSAFEVDEGPGEADAHLIAAAPDLLAACEVALKSAISFLGDGETSPVRRKLLAAIRKAEGETT